MDITLSPQRHSRSDKEFVTKWLLIHGQAWLAENPLMITNELERSMRVEAASARTVVLADELIE